MAGGMLAKVMAPTGLIMVLVGALVAILAFVFILLDLTGDFARRVVALLATTLPLIIGGVALAWLAVRP